ncbi:MAG: hypothetical protein UW41_C0036G0005 [Candidatus Collierbacteria bacterium GW2011_GWC2_44_18]|uniref:Uncharacterized protein n=2 Tax=Microgenomates group TaxID=1794810 RepID=A0A0G1J4U3_9BACT|nr:MAG: hypothetical protein UW16_C0025G0004 [Microgenomates group bacterium GW2011_GWC1_44_10]KKT48247.1 MAG: hypothetical protein UW41_C0036G0005 [Candidatus Collierbacteria bacterium GW2011_GWC2_44_18]KKT66348.1 MAG: hypothetical protein UW60_C0025G0008 [Candidatus Woesebacteria bacterium GW2011_GWA2_44_33]
MLTEQDKMSLKKAIYQGIVQVIEEYIIPKYQKEGLEIDYLIKTSDKYKKRITGLEKAVA